MTKTEQFQIIQQTNPAPDDQHTWIRTSEVAWTDAMEGMYTGG